MARQPLNGLEYGNTRLFRQARNTEGSKKRGNLLKEKMNFHRRIFPEAPSKKVENFPKQRKKRECCRRKERPQKSECGKEGPLPIPIITQASRFLDAFLRNFIKIENIKRCLKKREERKKGKKPWNWKKIRQHGLKSEIKSEENVK